MGRASTTIKAEVDQKTDLILKEWAESAERSKGRHAAIILRRAASRWDEKRRGLHNRETR
jgi:hypothetical protein